MKRIVFALLLSLFTVSCQSGDEDPAKGPSEVEPLASQLACGTVDDCIVISSSCDGCCQRTSVNRRDSISYEKHRAEGCSIPSGYVCDCRYLPVTPVCEDSKCGLAPAANP
jgi:hypothetical protein